MRNKFTCFSTILIFGVLMTLPSCDETLLGSGKLIREVREVKAFDAINVSGGMRVYVTQGSTERLEIEADDNLLQYIDSYVRGGTLYLETRDLGIRNATMRAYITVRNLERMNASGAVKITGESPLEFKRLTLEVSGASDIDMEVYGNRIGLKVSGAGKTNLRGEVDNANIRLSGASKLNAEALYTNKMEVAISGAGLARVNVKDELIASISGAGSIRYHGDPRVHSRVSGAGNVKKLD